MDYPLEKIAEGANDRDKFMAMYPYLRDNLLEHFTSMEQPPEVGHEEKLP